MAVPWIPWSLMLLTNAGCIWCAELKPRHAFAVRPSKLVHSLKRLLSHRIVDSSVPEVRGNLRFLSPIVEVSAACGGCRPVRTCQESFWHGWLGR
jgi:hypothetical protein